MSARINDPVRRRRHRSAIVNVTVMLLLVALPLCISAATNARVPPSGIPLSTVQREELASGVAALAREIQLTRSALTREPQWFALLPDVLVFHKAVDWALRYDEFYRTNEIAIAQALLRQGTDRAQQLRERQAPWLSATGLVVRGYRSRIDGSVQPYGLVIPAGYASHRRHRLDVWLHGRDNHLTELKFISDRQRSPGEFTPQGTLVLHPYGRYCNAFKFAGETDVFEALEHVRKFYAIDETRLAVRGFSMGGAGAWHLAAHHPGRWAVATPGAGFAESAEYTKALRRDPAPPWFEQKLWQVYDATDYALNFAGLPVIAYDGEQDPQRQAADVMERAMAAHGLELTRVTGKNVGHKYTVEAKQAIESFVEQALAIDPASRQGETSFTTRTLRYAQGRGVTLLGLDEHWQPASIRFERDPAGNLLVHATNVTAFRLAAPPANVRINGGRLQRGAVFMRDSRGHWKEGSFSPREFRKSPGLQGPIDDAFMDRFIMVRPTGAAQHALVDAWVHKSLELATNEWRAQFRGEAVVKDDHAITDADIAENNLVLWGDPRSNRILARIRSKLPLTWTKDVVRLGSHSYAARNHVPVLIYPNPLNPRRYVVVNTGFTFADAGTGSNARQTPKLPDYGIVQVNGEVVAAGFFDERWELR